MPTETQNADHPPALPYALLIMRLSLAAFMGVWSSLKFYRPSWFENVFQNAYGLSFISADVSVYFGALQMALVLVFAIGLWRTYSYGLIMLMQAAGVIGSYSSLMNFTKYPNNLLWTSVPALGAIIALWLMRECDLFTVDGWRRLRKAR